MQKKRLVRLFAVVLGALLILPAVALAPAQASPLLPLRPGPALLAQIPQNQNFVASAVETVGKAVVRIDTERTVTRRSSNPLFEDPFFRPFFGDQMQVNPSFEQRLRGQGSGFIIDGDGLILTNAHVVDRADRVSVRLKDGRTFNGEVLGADEVTDLAVVRIVGSSDLPVASLGDSDQVNVGDWAIAVGNPLGLDNTVTLGIVSTLNRSSSAVGIPDKRLEFIQTDAAINPGNSGGPLLNDRGQVIGVNTAIRANANGIGFAIPINKVKEITPQLARGEQVEHPYIGVQIATLTPRIAQDNNSDPNSTVVLPEVNGVLVTGIQPGTPAASSGLRRGDVIVSIDGQAVTSAADLQNRVDDAQVGQNLQLQVRRGEQAVRISVRTANLENT